MKKSFLAVLFILLIDASNAQETKILTINTAGTLATVIGRENTKLTNLTLIGKIDVRDFKFMRDSLSLLTEVNLKGTTIMRYEGSDGTKYSLVSDWNGLKKIPKQAIYYANEIPYEAFNNCMILKKVALPEKTTSIGISAFGGCKELISVEPVKMLTKINDLAFSRCYKLQQFDIFQTLDSTGNEPFLGCNSLKTINITTNAGKVSNLLKCFDKKIIEKIIISGNIDVRDFRFLRDEFAILQELDLSKVQILAFNGQGGTDNSVTIYPQNEIPVFSFCNIEKNKSCTNLKKIELPKTATSIGKFAFAGCESISKLIIPAAINQIGTFAFSYCENLNTVSILSPSIQFDTYVFSNSKNIKSIYLYSPDPIVYKIKDWIFMKVIKDIGILYIPKGSKQKYLESEHWKMFVNINEFDAN